MEKMLKSVRSRGLSPLRSVKKTSPLYAPGGCFSQLQSRGKDFKVRSFTSKVSQEQVSVGTSRIFEIHLAQEKGLEQKGEFGTEGYLEKRAAIQRRHSQSGRYSVAIFNKPHRRKRLLFCVRSPSLFLPGCSREG